MEFFLTDKCFLFVLFIGSIICLSGLRKRPTRQALSRLWQRPLALSSAIILLFFLCIAVLDSIHLNQQFFAGKSALSVKEQSSLLDYFLFPLGSIYEKTYSAPLALESYSAETVFVAGKLEQGYTRLKYPSVTMQTERDKNNFLWRICLKALVFSFIISSLLGLVVLGIYRLVHPVKKPSFRAYFIPGKSSLIVMLTCFICFFLVLASYWISRELHLLGTGKIGEDIYYYAVKSIRTGLVIGILTTLFMLPLALILGISAGYYGGLIDDLIQYIYTTLSSIPGVLLITASVLSMQTYIANHPQQFSSLSKSADARLLALCLILGVTSWTSLCRLLRAEALKLREVDYVLAARALGSSSLTILRKHLLPNVMHIVLITLVLDFSFLVLAEAVLSYVGVGVSPMTISWGNMINGARLELAREPIVWWPIMTAFSFMFVLVLAANLLADALRDVFDPRQTN